MSDYTTINWNNTDTPISATNLNKMDNQIKVLSDKFPINETGVNLTQTTVASLGLPTSPEPTVDNAFAKLSNSLQLGGISFNTTKWGTTKCAVAIPFRDVFYGDGKFVAVTGGGMIKNKAAYSTDGFNWTEITMPISMDYNSVTYGDGKFVAVGGTENNKAVYSLDGINWTITTMPVSANWCNVVYGGDKFVAVASNPNIAAYSTDGITWTQSNIPNTVYWRDVAYGNGKFVAVAGYGTKTNVAAYSLDGINWTQITMPATANWIGITYGGDRFVVVTGDTAGANIAAYSTNGVSWTQSEIPAATWRDVAYGDGKFVAVANAYNYTAYSTDGINWTPVPLPSFITYLNNIVYDSNDNKFVSLDGAWVLHSLPIAILTDMAGNVLFEVEVQ